MNMEAVDGRKYLLASVHLILQVNGGSSVLGKELRKLHDSGQTTVAAQY